MIWREKNKGGAEEEKTEDSHGRVFVQATIREEREKERERDKE